MEHKVYLSRRNIGVLLSKLDRVKAGDRSACTLIKQDNTHPIFPQTMVACLVTGLEDTKRDLAQHVDHIQLTRTNLAQLLSSLNTKKLESALKVGAVTVLPVEDLVYYRDRNPGPVNPVDEPKSDPAPKVEEEEDDSFLGVAASLLEGLHDETGQREEEEEKEESSSTEGGDTGGGGASEDIPDSEPDSDESDDES